MDAYFCYVCKTSLFKYCTCFILALNVIASDGAVPIKSHSPAESDGPLLHLPNLHFRRLWWL